MENIKIILEIIASIVAIAVSIITIIKISLKIKENNEDSKRNNIINNHGNIIGNITQNQYNQTHIYKIEQNINNIQQTQKRVEEISNIIESCFSKGIIISFVFLLFYNVYEMWNNNSLISVNSINNITYNFTLITSTIYKSFGQISSIIIPLIFFLSFLLLIKNIVLKKDRIKTIFIISILFYANIINLKVFSKYSLNEQVIKLIENNNSLNSISIHSILFNPLSFMFILISIIITGIYLTSYLLKVTLTEIEFGPKKKLSFVFATFIYLGIPILIFYNYLLPDITLLNIHQLESLNISSLKYLNNSLDS